MARQLRIEYSVAIYHVMARGDRRESIVLYDEDCEMFLETLGEACHRSGFMIHAYVLLPKAIWWTGCGGCRTHNTRRYNGRHKLRGMGDRAYCSHLMGFQKYQLKNNPKLRVMKGKVLEIAKKLD